jgi:hypothetical protein
MTPMNILIKTSVERPFLTLAFIPIALTFFCAAAAPKAFGIVPAPDGGYPGFNTAEGQNALKNLSSGQANTAVGWFSLFNNAEGSFNTATGAGALLFNTADENTAFGAAALLFNTIGSNNTAVGTTALLNNTTGGGNTAVGFGALFNTTGTNNIGLGGGAGENLTTGQSNIDIGDEGVAGESNTIRIGSSGFQNRAFIAGIRGVTTGRGDAIPVLIDSAGQLGTLSSSRRFKNAIKPMDKASEAILALKPVTFHYKSDNAGTPQFGLIAEEVAEINPDLVVRDENGEIYTVRYDAVNAMLLNEFLKEHHKVQELEATVAQERRDFETTITGLKKEMESIIARSNEQDAKIQKVSTQVELNQAALRTVADY